MVTHRSGESGRTTEIRQRIRMKGYMTIAMVVALGFALIFGTTIPQVHASSLAIDGTAKYQGACATTCTVALTTGTTNDVIYLIFTSVVTPTTNPPTVTD